MRWLRALLLAILIAADAYGGECRTANFVVSAPSQAQADQAGQYAEYYRREKALQWLGREMPTWGTPCPLKIKTTATGSGGMTSFVFDGGGILSQHMQIEGTFERLMNSVLPHEITHTVFAYYFRRPMPRWADEGGAVLSEDDLERSRHDRFARQILNTPGRAIPLKRLFALSDYPDDILALYAEGYSVTNFLVGLGGRPLYLDFVAKGMGGNWDGSARSHYRFDGVEDLERAWIDSLRRPVAVAPAARSPARSAAEYQATINQLAHRVAMLEDLLRDRAGSRPPAYSQPRSADPFSDRNACPGGR